MDNNHWNNAQNYGNPPQSEQWDYDNQNPFNNPPFQSGQWDYNNQQGCNQPQNYQWNYNYQQGYNNPPQDYQWNYGNPPFQQPNYIQPPYQQIDNSAKNMAIASLVLGIVSLCISNFLGLACAIVGLVLGVCSKKRRKVDNEIATAGIILSSIGLAASLLLTLINLYDFFFLFDLISSSPY